MKQRKPPVEIKNLYDMGFAIHWLRPRSKIPVESGWTQGERQNWDKLARKYKAGFNPGVRLGYASKVNGAYLAVIDVDIKSKNPKHKKEALATLFKLFPQCKKAPYLLSGRGNGSAHYYVRLKKPVAGEDVKARSEGVVKVLMPSVKPSRKEGAVLSPEALKNGVRLRPAWEIALMSEGRQAALVGAIHPDTGEAYKWGKRKIERAEDIPLVKVLDAPKKPKLIEASNGEYKFVDVAAEDLGLSEDQTQALVHGDGVKDRSAECFSLCMALLQRKTSTKKILSVLTNRDYYLGQTGFDHAKTTNRQRAARWIDRYCLQKAMERVEENVFDLEEIRERPAKKNRKTDIKLPQGIEALGTWADQLELKSNGNYAPPTIKNTYLNIRLILGNSCERGDFLKRDVFKKCDLFVCKTPWGNSKGQQRSANQDDALAVKKWLAEKYGMEPSLNQIDEVLNTVALENQYHPVKDYLESLTWDGTERINNAFRKYLKASMPEPYLSTISRKFFIACVRRVYEPGCKFDHVVVLEGKQGIGKSTFGNILAGDTWFLDGLPNLQDKDAALYLHGTWICELGELAAIYRSTNEATKTFIARRTDRIRPPYGQRRMDYPRSTVFLGTTDKNDYLTDTAGNRRWWPVRVKGCQFKELQRDRDQLWAEALFWYHFEDEPLYLKGVALDQARIIQEMRRVEDEGDAMGRVFSDWVSNGEPIPRKIRLTDLFTGGPFADWPMTRGNTMRAGDVLRRAGYRKKHTNEGSIWVV